MEETPEFMKNSEEDLKSEAESKDLFELKAMIQDLNELDYKIEQKEEEIKGLRKKRNSLGQEHIPDFINQRGLSEMRLKDGRKVIITEDISVTIKDEPMFHKFLKERGDDDIIKTQLSMKKLTSPESLKIVNLVDELSIDYEIKESVNSSTRAAYFRSLLGYGKKNNSPSMSLEDIPDYIRVFTYKNTQIK